jgi:hypothetical protein
MKNEASFISLPFPPFSLAFKPCTLRATAERFSLEVYKIIDHLTHVPPPLHLPRSPPSLKSSSLRTSSGSDRDGIHVAYDANQYNLLEAISSHVKNGW